MYDKPPTVWTTFNASCSYWILRKTHLCPNLWRRRSGYKGTRLLWANRKTLRLWSLHTLNNFHRKHSECFGPIVPNRHYYTSNGSRSISSSHLEFYPEDGGSKVPQKSPYISTRLNGTTSQTTATPIIYIIFEPLCL